MTRPVVVFNAASRNRRELVEVATNGAPELVSVAVPACGYSTIDLDAARPSFVAVSVSDRWLENELLRVTWDDDGLLTSVFDKEHRREVLAPGRARQPVPAPRRQPAATSTRGTSTSTISTTASTSPTVTSIEVVERDPLRAGVRFVREFGDSTITQTIRLVERIAPARLRDRRRLARAPQVPEGRVPGRRAREPRATYEIQYGHLERPTHVNTSWDVARFEVCAHRWADLSEPGYGVALLNDCKYGYDIHGNVMRLSLLRSPGWPDPESDQGAHRFSYALFPHAGDLREAGVIAEAEAFNLPLVRAARRSPRRSGSRPLAASIVRADRPNVTVEAVKKADREDALVVRVSEAWGTRGRAQISTTLPVTWAARVDVLEREIAGVPCVDGTVELDLKPFEIVTLKFSRATTASAVDLHENSTDRANRDQISLVLSGATSSSTPVRLVEVTTRPH